MRAQQLIRSMGAGLVLTAVAAVQAAPLGNAIPYQGQIKADGLPINDPVDLRFTLWDAAAGGTSDPDVLTKLSLSVVNGLFTTTLDFGAGAFEGSAKWLAIEVRHPAGLGAFVSMGARQPINAAPYAVYALNAPGGGGGGTLNQAYDFGGPGAGRTITADSGAVSINGSGAGGALFATTTGTGQVAYLSVPATSSANALYGVTYGSGRAASFESHQAGNLNAAVQVFKNGGPALRVIGGLNAGTAATDAPLAVIGGSDSEPTGGGFLVLGSTASSNISFDNNEIMARNNGAASTLHLNHEGGTVAISANNGGYGLGIGTTTPKQRLHVVGDYYGRGHLYLYAIEGDGSSGTAYVQARDDSTTSNIDLRLRTKLGNSVVDNITCKSNGRVGIGTTAPANLLDVAGTARVNVLTIDGGADLSENFDVLTSTSPDPSRDREGAGPSGGTEVRKHEGMEVEAGMVVAIDPENPGKLRIATSAYDSTVAGIISGAGGIGTGMVMAHEGTLADGKHPVALTGRVYCKVDASYGAIKPGDLLTTSDTPGHAMKVVDRERAHGAILGKAITSLTAGEKGLVLVLVSLQ